MVTYFANSGYNHPDHLKAHDVTVAALDACGIPSKLYLIARTRAYRGRMREIAEEYGIELPQFLQPQPPAASPTPDGGESVAEAPPRPFGVDDSLITTYIDGSRYAAQKRAALAAHASQLEGSFFLQFPGEAFSQAFGPSRSSVARYHRRSPPRGRPVRGSPLTRPIRRPVPVEERVDRR